VEVKSIDKNDKILVQLLLKNNNSKGIRSIYIA